jgi:hypothetical protein
MRQLAELVSASLLCCSCSLLATCCHSSVLLALHDMRAHLSWGAVLLNFSPWKAGSSNGKWATLGVRGNLLAQQHTGRAAASVAYLACLSYAVRMAPQLVTWALLPSSK